jgi:hypothetical protein
MAINVNTVYQTVLLILNKEQRGYMTPVEFNKIGTQVQLEIFEKYFEDLNQQIRIPQTNTDYADRVLSLDEKLSIFKTSQASVYNPTFPSINSFFALPTGSTQTTTNTFPSTGANNYIIPNTTANQSATNGTVSVNGVARFQSFSFTTNVLTFTADIPPASVFDVATSGPSIGVGFLQITLVNNAANAAIPIGALVTGANTVGTPSVVDKLITTNTILLTLNVGQTYVTGALLNFTTNITTSAIWTTTGQSAVYRLGNIIYTNGAMPSQELERVTRSELYHLLSSNLTRPTTTYPIYLYEDQKIFVYPRTIQDGINVDYIRRPSSPSWNFTSSAASNYAYIFDANSSINFELHQAEQTEVILKILLYAGVVIKDPQIIQAAAAKIQGEEQNQKS